MDAMAHVYMGTPQRPSNYCALRGQHPLMLLYTQVEQCGINSDSKGNRKRKHSSSSPHLIDLDSSQHLREFQAISFPLGLLHGHVVEFACDEIGSRYLQYLLSFAPAAIRNAIWEELKPSIDSLILDKFGNHVIQRVLIEGLPHHKYVWVVIAVLRLIYMSTCISPELNLRNW